VASHYDRIENEVSLLGDQRDQSHFLKSQQRSIRLEQLEAYVIPHTVLFERLNKFISIIEKALQQQDIDSVLSIQQLQDSSAVRYNDTTITTHDITVSMKVNRNSILRLFTMLNTSGMLTLYDAFTPTERQELLEVVLNEDPGSLQALETFFASSLLDYSAAPEKHIEQLLVFIASENNVFVVQDILRASQLQMMATFLKQASVDLRPIWPAPLLEVQSATFIEQGDYLEGTLLLQTFTQ
jgi:hypothetical protein